MAKTVFAQPLPMMCDNCIESANCLVAGSIKAVLALALAGGWAGFNAGPSLQPPMGDLMFNGGGLGSFGGPPTPPGPHPFGPLDAGLGSFSSSLGASSMPGEKWSKATTSMPLEQEQLASELHPTHTT